MFQVLIVESTVPYLLNVIPIRADTVLNRTPECQDTAPFSASRHEHNCLLVHADHDAWYFVKNQLREVTPMKKMRDLQKATVCDTPSQKFITMPVSNMICVMSFKLRR